MQVSAISFFHLEIIDHCPRLKSSLQVFLCICKSKKVCASLYKYDFFNLIVSTQNFANILELQSKFCKSVQVSESPFNPI